MSNIPVFPSHSRRAGAGTDPGLGGCVTCRDFASPPGTEIWDVRTQRCPPAAELGLRSDRPGFLICISLQTLCDYSPFIPSINIC